MEVRVYRNRLTIGRLAGSLAAAAALAPGWAEIPRAVADEPMISIVTARPQPMMANLGDEYRGIRLGPDRPAFERTAAALAEHHDLDFHDTPLREAVAMIADKAGIGIGFDHESLEDVGLDIDAAGVSGSFKDVSLQSALRELLGDTDLDLVFRNERLVVTTAEAAGQHVARFFYPMLAGTDIDELIALIEGTVAPASWNSAGGPGAIMPLPGQMGAGLVVSQTEKVHGEIAGLLHGLDAALWMADPIDEGVEPRLVRVYPVADPVVREAAAERLVDLCNEALPHAADPEASVEVIGESIVVRSASRPFQVMAAQVLAALQGIDTILLEEDGGEGAEAAPADAHATRYRPIGWPSAAPGGR